MSQPFAYDAPLNLTAPSQVKAWCLAQGFHPNKNLGQNFLVDQNILQAIVTAAAPVPGAPILEIGPGLGVLTEALLQREARVTAIEKDTRLAGRLAAALGNPAALEVLAADALEVDWDRLLQRNFAACVSNLPYSSGTRILMDLALHPLAPPRFVILVQTEVAERLAAAPGSRTRGLSGVWLQLDYVVQVVRQVKASCFWPRPAISSSIVHLQHQPCTLSPAGRTWFFALTRWAFAQRRKQLATTLRKASAPLCDVMGALEAALAAAHIPPTIRPEGVSNAQWQSLAEALATASGQRMLE